MALPPKAVARTLAAIEAAPAEATASMQRDLGAGRPSELEEQVGAVVWLAAEVSVPVHGFLLAVLGPQEAAARGQIAAFPRT